MTPITNNAQKTDLIIYYRNGLKNNTGAKPSVGKQALSKAVFIYLAEIIQVELKVGH